MRSSESFNWLHLTDLHYGGSRGRFWPTIREAFFADLKRLHEACGPWHAVLFTGDLVQTGRSEEFAEMESEFLERLWEVLADLGSGDAILLAVPGNHDLVRPSAQKPSPALRQLLRQNGFYEVEDELWSESGSEYLDVLFNAFDSYQSWWNRTPFRRPILIHGGLLPGDFAATLSIGSHRVGIVGLNTAFLQLTAGDYRGRLALSFRQLQGVCGDVDDWVSRHDICLLLTHHGPDWLDARSRDTYPEINPAGRFAVHLFGHLHEMNYQSTIYGDRPLLHWQGSSLFGLESYGEQAQHERRHGYSTGSISFGKRPFIRFWPRRFIRTVGGWSFFPDSDDVRLEDDAATKPTFLESQSLKRPSRKVGGKIGRQPDPPSDPRVFLSPEDLLHLAFRLVVARRAGPDLLLHLDAARLREAIEGVLDESSSVRSLPRLRLRAVANWLAEQFPDALPDPLWQQWMLKTQAKNLEDLATMLASSPSSSAPPA